MNFIIKVSVDSKLNKEDTRRVIEDSIKKWVSDNDGCFHVAQDHDHDDEKLVELDNIIVN